MSIQKRKTSSRKTDFDQKLPLKKAVFDYATELYKNETERQETLENKSRFYLSFISLFIGSAFFNLDFLNNTKNVITQTQLTSEVFITIIGGIITLNASLLLSLISILVSIGIKSYKDVYPKNITFELFSPTSQYIKEKNLEVFYETISMNYTIALEYNKNVNDKKALWINIASIFVLISILALAVLLSVISTIVFFS